MSLKVALTGATGFVGRKVVAELLANKHAVTALVRDMAAADLPDAVWLVNGDLQNDLTLDDLTNKSDVVIHVAGLISAVSRQDYFVVNERGTRAVAQAAIRNGVKHFVHVSSLSAREPQLSTYGKSKLAGEEALMGCPGTMSRIILRPPAVYGPGDRATLPLLKALTQTLAVLPGCADARFSLIHVQDLARIAVAAATSSRTGIVELGDGATEGHDWKELACIAATVEHKSISPVFLPKFIPYGIAFIAEAIAAMRHKPSMISRGKINELYHTDWVARGEGWPLKSPTGFAQGFAETLAWYRHAGWLPPNVSGKITT
jgi:nucleoside-diphosphate-sugar epimerase